MIPNKGSTRATITGNQLSKTVFSDSDGLAGERLGMQKGGEQERSQRMSHREIRSGHIINAVGCSKHTFEFPVVY